MKLTATLFLTAALAIAETPITFTATTQNVGGAPDSIRINVLRWSTDAERDQLLDAWNMKTPPPAPAAGRGGGRGAAPAPDPDPAAADAGDNPAGAAPAAAPAAAARGGRGAGGGGGGRGGGGRGGGGGGRGGGGGAAAAPTTPESSLAAALGKAPTVGYLWSSEVAGYSLRSAIRLPQPDGGERILLITERRLGAWNDLWKPAGAEAPSNYEFSVIELRLNAKGEGEGRISLTGKVALDAAAKTVAPENFTALPVVLKSVKRAK